MCISLLVNTTIGRTACLCKCADLIGRRRHGFREVGSEEGEGAWQSAHTPRALTHTRIARAHTRTLAHTHTQARTHTHTHARARTRRLCSKDGVSVAVDRSARMQTDYSRVTSGSGQPIGPRDATSGKAGDRSARALSAASAASALSCSRGHAAPSRAEAVFAERARIGNRTKHIAEVAGIGRMRVQRLVSRTHDLAVLHAVCGVCSCAPQCANLLGHDKL